MMRAVAVLAVVLGGVACGPVERPAEHHSRPACSAFRSAARDAVDGVLTPEEFRSRLQRVDSEAGIAAPAVQAAARDLLRVVTEGRTSGPAFDEAVTALGDACRSEGL